MLNPDYISPWIGIPLFLVLVTLLVILTVRDRRRRKREVTVVEDRALDYSKFDVDLMMRRKNAQPIFDQMDFDDIVQTPNSLKHNNVTPIKKD